MKKAIIVICLVIASAIITAIPFKIEAKTLRQAYADLATLQANATNTANKKQLTEAEMATTRNEIAVTYKEIKDTEAEIVQLQSEISVLNTNISKKNEEIKELAKYLQVSTNESAYLEYAFGSETLTEFVYRLAVVQQLNDYNSNLIIGMKADVKSNEEKTIQLAGKQKELDKKSNDYANKLSLLGEAKQSLEEAYSDITADIAEAKTLLSYYEKVGCKMDDELDVCAGKLAYNATYKRPVNSARISSAFGPRNLYGQYHYGMDLAIVSGTAVYPIANGIVTSVTGANDKSTCGGLTLTIIYNLQRQYDTSVYMHLSSTPLRVGQVVSVNQVAAYSGNSGSCTTGAHLHFSMTYKARYVSGGLYGIPSAQVYSSYDAYKQNSFNQQYMFKFGGEGSSFYSRDV